MRKIYIKVEQTICVNAEEGLSVDDIMDSIDIDVTTTDENVDILDNEIDKFYVTDSK
jgi:hypothetical protein